MLPNLMYVGTYTRLGRAKGIYVYRQDPTTGKLKLLDQTDIVDPSFLAFDPNKRFLFAVSETKEYQGSESGSVVSYAIDQATGKLMFLSQQATGGGDPCHLCTDPTGRFLFVANHESGSVCVLPIDPDGRLQPASDLVRHVGSGPGPTQKGPHAHFTAFDPSGTRLLVNDKGIDKVMIYRLDAAAGKLVPNDPPFGTLHSGAAPRHLAFHPNGRYVYVNGEADLTANVFSYDGSSGKMSELQSLSTLPEGGAGERQSTAQLAIHPSGRFLYVANRGHDTIAIFTIDQNTGRLTAIGHQDSLGKTPRNFNIDPTGTFMYVANQNSDTIMHFRINQETGKLTATGDVTEVGGPVCIVFS